MPNRFVIHGILLFVALIYGANYSIAKIALPAYIEPFGFILLRLAAATGLFWLVALFLPKERIAGRDFRRLLLCALFGTASNMLFFFKGLSMTNPINASVIMTMTPIIVLIAAFFLKSETIQKRKIFGVILGAVGAYLLITKDGISLQNDTFIGDLFILLNASTYAIYLVLVKPLMRQYKPFTIIKWVFLFGFIMVIPFGAGELLATNFSVIPVEGWFSVTYVIVGATFTVYLLNVWSLQFVNSSVVGIYIYVQPIVSTFVAVTFREDPLDLPTVMYSLIIMLAVFIVSKK